MSKSRIEEIQVVVDPEGKVTIGVKGMKGDTCRKATEALEALLGEVEERVSEIITDDSETQRIQISKRVAGHQ
jgi:hypothetical protein